MTLKWIMNEEWMTLKWVMYVCVCENARMYSWIDMLVVNHNTCCKYVHLTQINIHFHCLSMTKWDNILANSLCIKLNTNCPKHNIILFCITLATRMMQSRLENLWQLTPVLLFLTKNWKEHCTKSKITQYKNSPFQMTI